MYYCSFEGCGRKYKRKGALKQHIHINHLGIPEKKPEIPPPCIVCGKTYTRNYRMKKHMKISHPDYNSG